MTEKEKCFAFYERWYTQICLLPEQDQLQLFKAICEYGIFGRQTELNIYLEAIMVNIRISIDRGKEKQENFLRLQREKSLKAVEARRRYKQLSGNPTQPTDNPRVNSGNPTQPNNKNKEQEQEQEQEQEDNNIEHSSTSTRNVDAGAEGNLKIEIVQSDKEKEQLAFYKSVAEFFNKTMEGKRIQRIKMLNNFRKSHIEARMKEYGKDAIIEVIKKASESDFLNGCGGKGFVATFDWIIRPNNFVKVLEGNYDNNSNNQTTTNYGTNNWQQDDVGTGCNNIADRRRRDAAWAEYAKRRLSSNEQSEEIPAALQDF